MPTAREIITQAVFLPQDAANTDSFDSLAVRIIINNHIIWVEFKRKYLWRFLIRKARKDIYDPNSWYPVMSDPEDWDTGDPVDLNVERVIGQLNIAGIAPVQVLSAALELLKENNTLWYKAKTEGA